MNTDSTIIESVERYLGGQMTPDEVRDFELRVHSNAYMAKIVDEYVTTHQALTNYATRQRFKTSMNLWHSELKNQAEANVSTKPEESKIKILESSTKPSRVINFYRRNKKHLAVAASVAFFSVLSAYVISNYIGANKKSAAYTELKKEIDNIKKSQRVLATQILDANNKSSRNVEKKAAASAKFGGTGFLIGNEGYIMTSFHLVKEATQLQVVNNGYGYDVGVVYADKTCDIALLKINDGSFEAPPPVPYKLYDGLAKMGQNVYTLGYPRTDLVFGEGSVSALTGFNDDTVSYQISVPLNPGNSGGPLFDEYGNIVGIISGKEAQTEASSFAIKSYYIADLLNHLDTLHIDSRKQKKSHFPLARMSRTQQIEALKPFIFEVRVIN